MKHNPVRQFNRKMYISGNVVEIYDYEKPFLKGLACKSVGRSNAPFTDETTKNENRKKVAARACALVRRTVNANPQLNKFLTITFAENVTDLDFAHYEFDKFVKRLKTRFGEFRYISVIEFQKRGAIHFHLLCNLPYVDVNELRTVWRNGFIKLNRIDNVDNVGAYVTKYMTKDNLDERLIGRKCYSMSKGLNKPQEYTDEEDIVEILDNLGSIKRIHHSSFETDYYGIVYYTQIILSCGSTVFQRSLFSSPSRKSNHVRVYDDDGFHPFAQLG